MLTNYVTKNNAAETEPCVVCGEPVDLRKPSIIYPHPWTIGEKTGAGGRMHTKCAEPLTGMVFGKLSRGGD